MMSKKKHRVFHLPSNYYDLGGIMGAIGTGAGILNNAIKAAKGIDTSAYEEKIKNYAHTEVKATSNDQLLNAWQNRSYMDPVKSKYDITGGSLVTDILGGIGSLASDTAAGYEAGKSLSNKKEKGGLIGTIVGGAANLIGQAIGAFRIPSQIRALNKEITAANNLQDRTFADAASNAQKNQVANMMYGYKAYGGPIGYGFPMPIMDAASYDVAKDNTLTDQMQVQSKNSTSFNPIFNTVSTFDAGGPLFSNNFTNGVTLVDQGGTHEKNPHEGVQMGIAPDGKPNLVEEGEAIFNNYVFSNRLVVPDEVRNKYKLRGPKDMTFAEAFREIQKESEERPNDPISQNGLENMAIMLARTQEAVRSYEGTKERHKAALGGHLFDGISNIPYMEDDENDETERTYRDEDTSTNGVVVKHVTNPGNHQNPPANSNLSGLRFVEPIANLGAVASDLMGWTNTPYTFDYVPPYQEIGFNPLSNYIPVVHFDTRYAANQAAQQAAATRDAIMQSIAPSRNAALLAADYNAQITQGDLLRQAAMEDYNMMVKREEFNRGTNQANSEMALKSALANQDAKPKYGQAALQQAKMNVDDINASMMGKATNIGNLTESIANMGREADARNDRKWILLKGILGNYSEEDLRRIGATESEIRELKGKDNEGAALGGVIKRKKKGLTY